MYSAPIGGQEGTILVTSCGGPSSCGSMLSWGAKQVLRNDVVQIDSGVLRAMLLTRIYRHGARSMEAIIATSQLAGKTRFERSSLPTEAQLDLHVDGQDFLAQVQQLELDAKIVDRLARAAHAVCCKEQTALPAGTAPSSERCSSSSGRW